MDMWVVSLSLLAILQYSTVFDVPYPDSPILDVASSAIRHEKGALVAIITDKRPSAVLLHDGFDADARVYDVVRYKCGTGMVWRGMIWYGVAWRGLAPWAAIPTTSGARPGGGGSRRYAVRSFRWGVRGVVK